MVDVIIPEILELNVSLEKIEQLDKALAQDFRDKSLLESALTRSLVSFQANKTRPIYRWYKYKEAFSASLAEALFRKYGVTNGRVLDPFAGSGTSLFVASELGLEADGIELLPIGQQIIETRKLLDNDFTADDFKTLQIWASPQAWEHEQALGLLPELRITKGAFSESTVESIKKYIGAYQLENSRLQAVLRFALLCVLETISYTRKDGQYLRWDYRADRTQGKKTFDKGEIPSFSKAISLKIKEIIEDLQPTIRQSNFLPTSHITRGSIKLYQGSCLQVMPTLPSNSYDAVMTSPPYCNRYDYTRTYALELALLGIDDKGLLNLRQDMLSCTVENRVKDLLKINPRWGLAIESAERQTLLQSILRYLEEQKTKGSLNNSGIQRMVRGYFYEMACVISEAARVLKPGSHLFMVNDNVRYAGASISVDLILSSLAENLGFNIENILILPNGKGNSSQQMGVHGRDELRKCVYVWRKN